MHGLREHSSTGKYSRTRIRACPQRAFESSWAPPKRQVDGRCQVPVLHYSLETRNCIACAHDHKVEVASQSHLHLRDVQLQLQQPSDSRLRLLSLQAPTTRYFLPSFFNTKRPLYG